MSAFDMLDGVFANAVTSRETAIANFIAAQAYEFTLTNEQYNDICTAISELTDPVEQSSWDEFVLNFTYQGWTFTIISV